MLIFCIHKMNHEWGGKANTSVGRFSKADPVLIPVLTMRTDQHFWMWGPDWKPTSGSHMTENRLWEVVQMYIYIYGELDRFSHRTQIRFSKFSVSFIGSSCSSSHLGYAYIYFWRSGRFSQKRWEPPNTGNTWIWSFFCYFYWILMKKLL